MPAASSDSTTPHRHTLYEAAVQCVEADADFIARVFARYHGGRLPRRLREDFCGTAALCCEWVRRSPDHAAWGIDYHHPTLEWGRRHHLAQLDESARARVHLIEADVRTPGRRRVDAVAAFNFSYWCFKTRPELLRYFRRVHASLNPGGVFFLDAYGGTEAMMTTSEKRRIHSSRTPWGERVPAFRYIWETRRFNPINHDLLCYIHFELSRGRRIARAFRYDWRFWTLPEIRELLAEAGFVHSDVYVEGWDDVNEEGDGVYRRRSAFENQAGWVAYITAARSAR